MRRLLLLPLLALGACALPDAKTPPQAPPPRTAKPAPAAPPKAASLRSDDIALAEALVNAAMETASDSERRSWANKASGNSGDVTPLRTFATANGYFCRDYSEIVRIGSRATTTSRTVCRDTDGRWVPID